MITTQKTVFNVFAIWLILLAISPFQGPFATYDLARPVSDATAPHADSHKLKISSDATLAVSAAGHAAAVLFEIVSLTLAAADLVDGRKILLLHSVLRL